MLTRLSILLLILCPAVVLLASCGGGRRQAAFEDAAASGPADAAAAAGLPGFALPAIPLETGPAAPPASHEAMLLRDLLQLGDEAESFSGASTGEPGKLLLNPAQGGFSWAMYRFEGISMITQVNAVQATLDGLTANTPYYIGLPNYASGRWDLTEHRSIIDGLDAFQANSFDPQQHVSATGSTNILLIAAQASAVVEQVYLSANVSLPAPTGLTASDGEFDGRVVLIWNQVPENDGYLIQYKLSSEPELAWTNLAETATDTNSFQHLGDFPPEYPCEYGVEYDYRVQTMDFGFEPSPFSEPDSGLRRVPAPISTFATDQLWGEDRVVIGWEMADPESDYTFDVYRDGEAFISDLNPALPGGGLIADNDLSGLLDFLAHDYHVVAKSPEGESLPGPVDSGCLGDWVTELIDSNANSQSWHADLEVSADPLNPVPTIAYGEEEPDEVRYYTHADGGGSSVLVAAASNRLNLALLNHAGRPWILFNNDDFAHGDKGVFIARGKSASPGDGEDGWDIVKLAGGEVDGDQLCLEVIDGRLTALYAVTTVAPDTEMRYARATVDDPQTLLHWSQSLVFPVFESQSPRVFDLAERDGAPAVAMAFDGDLLYAEASSSAPAGPLDWTVSAPLDSLVGQRALDLEFRGGLAHIAVGGGNKESDGDVRYYRAAQDGALGPGDWMKYEVDSYNDVDCDAVTLAFDNGVPLVAVADDRFSVGVVGVSLLIDSPHFGGFLGYNLGEHVEGYRCHHVCRLLETGGQMWGLYAAEFDNGGETHWGLFLSERLAK